MTHDEDHDRRISRVKGAIESDPTCFTATLLCAAFAEYYLKRLIATMMTDPNKFFLDSPDAHVDFAKLVRLAEAGHLVSAFEADMLRALAALRNRFAHDIDHVLCKKDLWRFRKVFYRLIDEMADLSESERNDTKRQLDELEIDDHLNLFLEDIVNGLERAYAAMADPSRALTLKARGDAFFQRLQEASSMDDLQL